MSVPVFLLWVPTFPSIPERTHVVTSSPPCPPLSINLSLALPDVRLPPPARLYLNPEGTFCSTPVSPSDRARASVGPHSSLWWD